MGKRKILLMVVAVLLVTTLLQGCIHLTIRTPASAKTEAKAAPTPKPKKPTPSIATTGQKALDQLLEKYKDYGGKDFPPGIFYNHGTILLLNRRTRYVDAIVMYYPPKKLGDEGAFMIFIEYPSCRVLWENKKFVVNQNARSTLIARARDMAEFHETTNFLPRRK